METNSDDLIEWQESFSFPKKHAVSNAGIRKIYDISCETGGVCNICYTSFKKIFLARSEYVINAPAFINYTRFGSYLEMFFVLQGTIQNVSEGKEMHSGEHNIIFLPEYYGKLKLIPEQEKVKTLSISMPREFLEGLVNISSLSNQLVDLLGERLNGLLHDQNPPLTHQMKIIIQDMQDCDRPGGLKKLLLQARVIELLMLQVEQIQQEQAIIPEKDKAKEAALIEAKNILEKNFTNPPTIPKLARMTGLNEFTLKKGFKELYNHTIYGYVNELRMTKARSMLLHEDISISEVAYAVGYKNAQHFSVAFKKYYNLLPSQVKGKK